MQEVREVEGVPFVYGSLTPALCCVGRESLPCNELRVADDVVEFLVSHLCEVFAHLTCQEHEEVDDVMVVATEVSAELRVLSGHTHRTCVCRALTHHDTSQGDERCRTETELLSTEQSHHYHVASCLHLSVDLQADERAQTVLDQCLLCLGDTYLR